MRTRLIATLALGGVVAATAACVSLKRTPEARFFVLQPLVEPPAVPRVPVAILGMERVRLPGHLDRPQVVSWAGPNEMRTDEFVRWAEPLDEGITRTVAANLAALLPDHQVVRRPWSGTMKTRCRIQISLKVFGLQRDGAVRLKGQYRLLPDRDALALVLRRVDLSDGPLPAPEEGTAAPDPGVQAMSRLLETLSREIADAVRALPADPEPAPPAEEPVALEDEKVTSEKIEE